MEMTSFMHILVVFSSRLARTLREVGKFVSTKDLSYVLKPL